MKKNTAGQHIAVQMNSRTNGSPLTTAVSGYFNLDGAGQIIGSGTLAHQGNGAWDYIPTQPETNGNHIAYSFIHITGVNQTLNVWTTPVDANITQVSGNATAATTLGKSLGVMKVCTVDTTNFEATTTELETGGITEAQADKLIGRCIIFTSGNLIHQAAWIEDYALVSGKGHLTVSALVAAPANSDEFLLI